MLHRVHSKNRQALAARVARAAAAALQEHGYVAAVDVMVATLVRRAGIPRTGPTPTTRMVRS
jgi:hypothetical protein